MILLTSPSLSFVPVQPGHAAYPRSGATGHAAYAPAAPRVSVKRAKPVSVNHGLALRGVVCHDGRSGSKPTRAGPEDNRPVTVIPQPAPITRSGTWPSMPTVRSPPHRDPQAWTGWPDHEWKLSSSSP